MCATAKPSPRITFGYSESPTALILGIAESSVGSARDVAPFGG